MTVLTEKSIDVSVTKNLSCYGEHDIRSFILQAYLTFLGTSGQSYTPFRQFALNYFTTV